MEITESMVYWITRLDGIKGLLCGGMVLSAIVAVIVIMGLLFEDIEHVKTLVWPVLVFIILGVTTVFVPTTKQMCAIKVIPIIANNDGVQELPDKVVDLANEWLDELKPNKETSDE